MLYELTQELRARLAGKGVPFTVIYGPERGEGAFAHERIVIDELAEGDAFGAAVAGPRGPNGSRMTSTIGAVARIYAQSHVTGAAVHDHRRRARAALDAVLVALDDLLRGSRRNGWSPTAGRFLLPADLADSETWPGAVYELRFELSRSVLALAWPASEGADGATGPTVALEAGGIKSTTRATSFAADDPAETACG